MVGELETVDRIVLRNHIERHLEKVGAQKIIDRRIESAPQKLIVDISVEHDMFSTMELLFYFEDKTRRNRFRQRRFRGFLGGMHFGLAGAPRR